MQKERKKEQEYDSNQEYKQKIRGMNCDDLNYMVIKKRKKLSKSNLQNYT